MGDATVLVLFAFIGAILGQVFYIASVVQTMRSDLRRIRAEMERNARSW